MKVLELFAGSKSIGKVAEARGHEVFSTDINDFEGIDLVKDVLDIQREDIPFVPDMIWASPPCTYFSVASIGKHWKKDHTPKTDHARLGIKVMKKTLEIISWFPDAIYYMENPRGKMRKVIDQSLPKTTVWYCKYGDIRAKPTDIWSNNIKTEENPGNTWTPRPQCKNGNPDCHHQPAPRGSRTGTQGLKGNYERSIVPEQLCEEVIEASEYALDVENYFNFLQ